MLFKKQKFSKILTAVGLSISLNFCLASMSSLVSAKEADTNLNKSTLNVSTKERRKTRKRSGFPIHRVGGGSRGNCTANRGQLVALVPEDSVGITASITPKLFFSVPETTDTHLIEFVVRNQQDELVYETLLETKDREGIIAIELPKNLQQESLKTNENYHWYLSMICNQQKRSHDIVVEGWLKRIEIEPTMSQKLQNADPIERANLYQQEGIWYDALSVVAQETETASQLSAAQAKWKELLTALGLEELVNQPLIETTQSSATNWLTNYSSSN